MSKLMIGVALMGVLIAFPRSARADDEYDQLEKDFRAAQQAYYESWQKRQDEATSQPSTAPATMPVNPAIEFAKKFRAFAEKRGHQSAAIPALVWQIVNCPGQKEAETATWAVETLTRDHAADPELGKHLGQLQYSYYAVGIEKLTPLYERIIKDNPDPATKSSALFNRAFAMYSGGYTPVSDEQRAAQQKEAAAIFRKIVAEFGETTAATRAAGFIFELDHLQIGMTAPEIIGTNVDDNEIKLSQFRGNVVVLDFWGFW